MATLRNIIILLLFPLINVYGQVTIAPTNLFIEGNNRFGTYMVVNGSNQSQEISIEFFFGYSESDEDGNRTLVSEDSTRAIGNSIAPYVRAFPQNFTLNPGERQVVRLRVSPPNNISDGTYWARIQTSSSPETPPLELQSADVVSARVGITVEQITGLYFKTGSVSTGIEVSGIRSQISEDRNKMAVLVDYLRTGNSPFLGSISISIVDSQGNQVKTAYVSTTLYYDGVHKQEFDIEDLSPGNYTINVNFETQRNDIPSSNLVQMQPVSYSESFTLR